LNESLADDAGGTENSYRKFIRHIFGKQVLINESRQTGKFRFYTSEISGGMPLLIRKRKVLGFGLRLCLRSLAKESQAAKRAEAKPRRVPCSWASFSEKQTTTDASIAGSLWQAVDQR